MQTNIEKLKVLIDNSTLDSSDQEDLIELFTKANDSELDSVVDLFSSDSAWIEKVNANYKAKKAIMKVGDFEIWKKIIEEEEKQLEDVEK